MLINDTIWVVRKNMEKIIIATAVLETKAAVSPLPLQCRL
jgi:hypothetical protein